MSGDKELREAFESTTNKNITAIINQWKIMKIEWQEQKEEIVRINNNLQSVLKEFEETKKQVAHLLQIAYAKGTTDGDYD